MVFAEINPGTLDTILGDHAETDARSWAGGDRLPFPPYANRGGTHVGATHHHSARSGGYPAPEPQAVNRYRPARRRQEHSPGARSVRRRLELRQSDSAAPGKGI